MQAFVISGLPLNVSHDQLRPWLSILTVLTGIHTNIAAFGGEPNNIMAIGQSVGAMAIGLHLTSFGGNRGVPFQKAM